MDLPKNIINSKALLIALDGQSESLPESLQQSLTQIGRDWQTNPTEENAKRLRGLIKSNESLEADYLSAVVELRRAYTSQERTKSSAATLPIEPKLDDYLNYLKLVLSSEDWVQTRKQANGNLAHLPEQIVSEKTSESFTKETSIFGKFLSAFQGWSGEWVLDLDEQNWDKQIERDVAAGKLDFLAKEALAELESGDSRIL